MAEAPRAYLSSPGQWQQEPFMKVFLAATSLQPSYGGPAFSVSRLALALTEAGADVALWTPDESAPATRLLRPDAPVRRMTGKASEALDRFGADVLHDNGIWLWHNHLLADLAAGRRIPRLVSIRGMLEPWAMNHKGWKKKLAWSLYQRRDLMRAHCHHTTAEQEARNVKGLDLGVPVRVIPNGVDIPESSDAFNFSGGKGNREGPKIALFLGRIYPVKGLPMLVEAWARIRPAGWVLQIAGPDEGGHRAHVERMIAAAGLQDAISFSGPIDGSAKARALLGVDLFVLPSHSESFGMAIAEALAHGVPVLTTKATPWPELPERGCGWQVEATIDGIAEGLRLATACDRETLHAMGANGRAWVAAEFGWERVAKEFMTTYEGIACCGC
jgi:glycosyltransferase involved in cell wall biosynthesis